MKFQRITDSQSNDDGPGGYHGLYLHVDLDLQTARQVALSPITLRRYLGGSGLGTWLLLQTSQADRDALAAETPLIFAFSPLVGSPLTTSAKFAILAKSPLTNRLNDSLVSSRFAIAGKQAGCDALVITGRAAEPSVLLVDDESIHLLPAGEAWGMHCQLAEQTLRRQHGAEYQAAVIGPAGENQVRYATISHSGRHAGRGGHGAVMGSKNLKAVLMKGSRRCRWAQPAQLHKLARRLSEQSLGPGTVKYRELGTMANVMAFNRLHILPTRNFQQGSFDGAGNVSPEQLSLTHDKTQASCAACGIGCEQLFSLPGKEGESGGQVRVEYENLFALGSLCGVHDADHVLRASQLCDQLGIDTISAGGTIAFAMECVERGLWDVSWLKFGSGEAVHRALHLIARREQIGNELAEGSRRLAEWIGQGSAEFAAHVKGLELPGYEPRSMQTLALGMTVNARGADHNRSGAADKDFSSHVDRRQLIPETARHAIEAEDQAALMDSLIICKFLRRALDDFPKEAANMIRLVTGWDVTAEELKCSAQHIITAKKIFNIRAGWQPAEDCLPARFLREALPDDSEAILSEEQLQQAVRRYNELRGWSLEGWVPPDQMAVDPPAHPRGP